MYRLDFVVTQRCYGLAFASIGMAFFTYAFGLWQFPPHDVNPSKTLYVGLLLAGIIIPLLGFLVGVAYGV